MKSWLTQFKISAAHDSGKPLPSSLSQAITASEELRRFRERTHAVEQALAKAKPKPQLAPPPSLHRSIMRAVEAAAVPAPARPGFPFLRWLAAPGLAVVLAVGLWAALKPAAPTPNPAPLATVSTTLEIGSNIPHTLPPVLVAPLSEELARLNQDLGNTAQFLLASVP